MPALGVPRELIARIRSRTAAGYHCRQLGLRLFTFAAPMQGDGVLLAQVQRLRRIRSIFTLSVPCFFFVVRYRGTRVTLNVSFYPAGEHATCHIKTPRIGFR